MTDNNPLAGKVCHDALMAGTVIEGGRYPPCISSECSRYEVCKSDILTALHNIDELNGILGTIGSHVGRNGVNDEKPYQLEAVIMPEQNILPATWDLNDPKNFLEVTDLINSPLHCLTFDEAIRVRKYEIMGYDEDNRKSKISVYADGKLRQAISIESENHKESAYQIRYLLFRHGEHLLGHEYNETFKKINSVYSTIIHSDNDESAADVSNPGKCTLSQCVDARSRPAIQLYITPGSHSEINDIAQRLGISMSDYTVICLWKSILTSDAQLPERLIEHGNRLLEEFHRKVAKRLKDLERIRCELS